MAQQSNPPKKAANYVHTAIVAAGYVASLLAYVQQMPGIPAKYQTFVGVALTLVTAGIHAAGSIGPNAGGN